MIFEISGICENYLIYFMKICVIRADKMGDMILTFPVIEGLKEANNNTNIDVICSQTNLKICNRIFCLKNKKLKLIKKNF